MLSDHEIISFHLNAATQKLNGIERFISGMMTMAENPDTHAALDEVVKETCVIQEMLKAASTIARN